MITSGAVPALLRPISACRKLPRSPSARLCRHPVLEVDDTVAERDRIVTAGWPLEEDLQRRVWGLTDCRNLNPAVGPMMAFFQPPGFALLPF
jgi:hypothetical protein